MNTKHTTCVPSEVLEIDVGLAEPLIPACECTNNNCTRACTREGSEEGRELAVASNNASVLVYYPSESHVGAKIGASRTDIEAKLSNEGVDDVVGAEEDSESTSTIQQLRNISRWLQQHAQQMHEAPRGQVDGMEGCWARAASSASGVAAVSNARHCVSLGLLPSRRRIQLLRLSNTSSCTLAVVTASVHNRQMSRRCACLHKPTALRTPRYVES